MSLLILAMMDGTAEFCKTHRLNYLGEVDFNISDQNRNIEPNVGAYSNLTPVVKRIL